MPVEVKHIDHFQRDDLSEFLNGSTYDAVFEAVSKYVPRGGTILDVGSGRGELLKRFAEGGYAVHGCDIDATCVALGSRYGKVHKLDIEEVTPDKFVDKFDCIVLSHVLEHVEYPLGSLKRLSSMSKAFVIVSIPNPYYSPFLVESLLKLDVGYVNTGHLYSWDWYHFKTFVEVGCGQKIVEWFYDSVALPVPAAIRRPLNKVGLLTVIEKRLLRTMRFCRSITAVIRVEQ